MATALVIVLGLGALAFVLYPLFRHTLTDKQDTIPAITANENNGDSTSAVHEQTMRTTLQEVELDYQLGNIEEPDYLALREEHIQRALVAFKSRSEHEQKIDEEIEAQVRRLKENYEKANM